MLAQLRIYSINRGEMDAFLEHFTSQTVPLHQQVGIPIEVADRLGPTAPIRPRTRTPTCAPSGEAADGDGLAPSVQDPHRPPGQPGQASSELHPSALTLCHTSARGARPRRRDSTTSSPTRQTPRSTIHRHAPVGRHHSYCPSPAGCQLQCSAEGCASLPDWLGVRPRLLIYDSVTSRGASTPRPACRRWFRGQFCSPVGDHRADPTGLSRTCTMAQFTHRRSMQTAETHTAAAHNGLPARAAVAAPSGITAISGQS